MVSVEIAEKMLTALIWPVLPVRMEVAIILNAVMILTVP
jgi:hypothetical protein